MKTIIAGGRNYYFTQEDIVFLDSIKTQITEVVCGMASGADTCGKVWAEENGIPVAKFPADWNKFGKSAGFRRNREMAEYAYSLIAFPGGTGTKNMVETMKKLGKPVIEVPHHTSQVLPFFS